MIRKFKTGLSDRKNQVLLKRAHELDDFLVKALEEVRSAAEVHVWNVNKKVDDLDTGYMKLLSQHVRDTHKNQLHYEGSSSGIPFKPIAYGPIFSEVDDEGTIYPSNLKEAQEKIDVLASDDGGYGDIKQE